MTNDVLGKVKAPAIGLLVTGILNILLGLYFIASAAMRIMWGALDQKFASDAEQTWFYVGFFGSTAFGILSLLIAPVVIFGAVQMMKGRKYGLSKTAAILAVIPFTSCCFLIGIPFGIWALVVLSKPDVKAVFNGETPTGQFNPPQPPQNW